MTRLVLVENKPRPTSAVSDVPEGVEAKQLLEHHDYHPRRQGAQNGQFEFPCPFHEEPGQLPRGKPTNFYLNAKNSKYYCQAASCGESGNLQTLQAFFGIESDPTVLNRYKNKNTELKEFEAQLTEDKKKFLREEKGLTEATIQKFRLGWRWYDQDEKSKGGCYVIPYLENRRPVAFRFYDPVERGKDDKGKSLYGGPHGSKYWWESNDESIINTDDENVLRLFNPGAAGGDPENHQVFICEGELKAMLLDGRRYHAVSIPGTNGFKQEWSRYFNHAREIYILMDNDNPERHKKPIEKCLRCQRAELEECTGHNPGQDGAAKLLDTFGFRAKNVVLPLPEGERKVDINEYLIRDQHSWSDFDKLVWGKNAESPYLIRTLGDIRKDPPPETVFLVSHGLLPKGGRLLVTGAPKVGKSIFIENLVLSIAAGIPFLRRFEMANDGLTPGHRVGLLDRELSERSLFDRLNALIDERPGYAAAEDKLYIDHKFKLQLDQPSAANNLKNLVLENNLEVLVLDTAYKFFCVDTETEALTKRGWLRYDEITEDDTILSMDPADKHLKWSSVKSIFRDRYHGKMFHLTGSAMDALVSPGHKFLRTDGSLVPIEQLQARDVIHTMGVPLRNDGRSQFSLDDESDAYEDSFVELVGWAVTEGNYWTSTAQGSTACTVTITQNPGKKADSIERALIASGAEWTETKSGSSSRAFRVRGRVARDIQQVAPDRVLSYQFINELTTDHRLLLIDTMVAGDGCVRDRDAELPERSYTQKDKAHTDAFGALCALAGVATTTTYREFRTKTPNGDEYDCKVFEVQLKKRTVAHVRNLDWHGGRGHLSKRDRHPTVDYDDIIWCPSTEYGTFVCRRNGKVFVTGNTGDMENAKSVAKAFASLDEVITETGVSVILTHHHRKGGGQGAKNEAPGPDQVMGSFLWTGWPNGTVLLNFKNRSVADPYTTIASFVAFRDAAAPEPLLLKRDKTSISYKEVVDFSYEELEEAEQQQQQGRQWSGSGGGPRPKLTYDSLADLLLQNVPVIEDEFLHGAAAHFGMKVDSIKIQLLDILDRHPDFVRDGKGNRNEPYTWRYKHDRIEEPYEDGLDDEGQLKGQTTIEEMLG